METLVSVNPSQMSPDTDILHRIGILEEDSNDTAQYLCIRSESPKVRNCEVAKLGATETIIVSYLLLG